MQTNLKKIVKEEIEIAQKQLLAVLNYCDREKELFRKIGGRSALITPEIKRASGITESLSSEIIFADKLNKADFLKRIKNIENKIISEKITDKMWKKLLSAVTGQNTYKESVTVYNDNLKSRTYVFKTS